MSTSLIMVPGSLAQTAGGLANNPHKMAMALRNAELMCIVDCSGSMLAQDAGSNGDSQRHVEAQKALTTLQERFPGRIAIGAFNSMAIGLVPSGLLPNPDGTTPLYEALLDFYPKAIALEMKVVLLSDGEPDDGPRCIALAQQYKYPIYCIYCGPWGDTHGGKEFLRRLAKESGGEFDHVTLKNIKLLEQKIAGYLMATKKEE